MRVGLLRFTKIPKLQMLRFTQAPKRLTPTEQRFVGSIPPRALKGWGVGRLGRRDTSKNCDAPPRGIT